MQFDFLRSEFVVANFTCTKAFNTHFPKENHPLRRNPMPEPMPKRNEQNVEVDCLSDCLSLPEIDARCYRPTLWTADQRRHVAHCRDCRRLVRQIERQHAFRPTSAEIAAVSDDIIDAFALGPEALLKIAADQSRPVWARLEAIDSIEEFYIGAESDEEGEHLTDGAEICTEPDEEEGYQVASLAASIALRTLAKDTDHRIAAAAMEALG